MEPFETDIEYAAGNIINEEGIIALTIDSLCREMGVSRNELPSGFKSDDDILKFLALRLENEIHQLIDRVQVMHHEPEKELQDLFKNLYDFFGLKLYFLELLFAEVILEKDIAIQKTLWRIRKTVENCLSRIIEHGKKTGVFNFHVSTKHEVESILNRFRFFMSDLPMTHKMIRDLKKIRESGE